MDGPAPSVEHVPLHDVLPDGYVDAEPELRRLGLQIECHTAAAGRAAWHWYPEHRVSPPDEGLQDGGTIYWLIADVTITTYTTGVDWLEFTLDISWAAPRTLVVNAAVEVACWCPQDHNMHQVRSGQWRADNSHELVDAFAAGTATLQEALASGPLEPSPWRLRAGLPDAPAR